MISRMRVQVRVHDPEETRMRRRQAQTMAKLWLFVLGAVLGLVVGIGITLWR